MEGRPDWAGSDGHGTRKSFNFADLPCPPQSVWEANNYTYYPGRPYQPLLALPQKLQDIDPAWSTCISNKYQGIDPPRILRPAEALDPGDRLSKFLAFTIVSSNGQVKDPPQSDPTKSAGLEQNPGRPTGEAADLTNTPVGAPKKTPAAIFDSVVLQEQTTAENKPPVTIGSSAIAYSFGQNSVGIDPEPPMTFGPHQDPNSIIVGSSKSSVVEISDSAAMLPTQGSYMPSVVNIGAHAVTQGAPPSTISGSPISLGISHLMIGSSIIRLPSLPTSFAVTLSGGQVFSADANSIGMKTLKGENGTTISSKMAPFSPGGQTFTNNITGVALAGTSVFEGKPGITISSTPVSFGVSGLVIGTSTFQRSNIERPDAELLNLFTVGGHALKANPTGFLIAGATLSPGGAAVTISGTPVSLGASGLVIGTSTFHLPDIFTVGTQAFTANPAGFSVAGTTLSPGGAAVTISGTPISLMPSGNLVIGSDTITMASSHSPYLGDMILSGLGAIGPTSTSSPSSPSPTTNSTVTVQVFSGSQAKLELPSIAFLLSGMAFGVKLAVWLLG
ncbi:hypothetical protein MMC16_005352 [Acarospora aff. strigata]|nr:hypothetical protein [Acarospora aff. strigata]